MPSTRLVTQRRRARVAEPPRRRRTRDRSARTWAGSRSAPHCHGDAGTAKLVNSLTSVSLEPPLASLRPLDPRRHCRLRLPRRPLSGEAGVRSRLRNGRAPVVSRHWSWARNRRSFPARAVARPPSVLEGSASIRCPIRGRPMTVLLDAAGRRRSPATLPGYHAGRPPRNKGRPYPADPPTVDEIIAVMRHAADDRHGWRLRAMIVVLWRAGLRVQEALVLAEHDLDHRHGSILVRNGKGGRRREVGMDEWGWEQLRPWLAARAQLLARAAVRIIDGPTRGRPWSGAAVRCESRRLAAVAGIRRRFAPPRTRARTRPRGRPAQHHPAPTRTRQSRHDQHLPAGDRPRGDHHGRAHAPRADDVRQRRAAAVIGSPAATSGSATALPLRPGEASAWKARLTRSSLVQGERAADRDAGARIWANAGAWRPTFRAFGEPFPRRRKAGVGGKAAPGPRDRRLRWSVGPRFGALWWLRPLRATAVPGAVPANASERDRHRITWCR
jgi:integrase